MNNNNLISVALTTPNNTINEPFTLCVLNAQSLNNKTAEFTEYATERKPDIITITETLLKNNESATRMLCTPTGYKLLDHPRSSRSGGGREYYSKKILP